MVPKPPLTSTQIVPCAAPTISYALIQHQRWALIQTQAYASSTQVVTFSHDLVSNPLWAQSKYCHHEVWPPTVGHAWGQGIALRRHGTAHLAPALFLGPILFSILIGRHRSMWRQWLAGSSVQRNVQELTFILTLALAIARFTMLPLQESRCEEEALPWPGSRYIAGTDRWLVVTLSDHTRRTTTNTKISKAQFIDKVSPHWVEVHLYLTLIQPNRSPPKHQKRVYWQCYAMITRCVPRSLRKVTWIPPFVYPQ